MTDIAPDAPPIADAPAPDAPAPDAVDVPAPDVPAADVPDAPAADGLEALPESWQKQIKDLRAENAKHRTGNKAYAEVFEPFDEPAQEVLRDLIKTLATDSTAGSKRMRELADLIEGIEPEAIPDPDADKPLTKADYDQLQKQQAEKTRDDQAQADIRREAEELGYTHGDRSYWTLLWSASNEHKGDLNAAHEALEAERQSHIDTYLDRKRKEADGTLTTGSGGAAPANDNPTKTFEQARASTEQRAKAALG